MLRLILNLFIFGVALLSAQNAHAQNTKGILLDEPRCFMLINQAPYSVRAVVTTEKFLRPDGVNDFHEVRVRLKPFGSLNRDGDPSDRRQICSAGPYFEGLKLRIMLRTMVPIYECKTAIDRGEVLIKGELGEINSKTWIECYDSDGTL